MPDTETLSATQIPTDNERSAADLGDYVLEQQIGFLLRRAHQHASRIFQGHMLAVELTPPQFSTLLKLYELGSVSQNRLGRLIDTDPATMQGISRRLCERGHVVRVQDPLHRRRVCLELTEQGRSTIEQALPLARRVTADSLQKLSAREGQQLAALLHKLVADPDQA